MLESALKEKRGHALSSEIGLKVRSSGLILPEGASGRFCI
jgi:hypothetical protein